MFNVKKFFQPPENEEIVCGDTLEKRIQIATCALFLEIANSDENFSDNEKELIVSLLKNEFDLSNEEVDSLIGTTKQTINKSIDIWQFTNLINQNFSDEEKIKILENIWKIIYADEKLDTYEDYLAHKISNLLRLPHKTLIESKMKVKNNERNN